MKSWISTGADVVFAATAAARRLVEEFRPKIHYQGPPCCVTPRFMKILTVRLMTADYVAAWSSTRSVNFRLPVRGRLLFLPGAHVLRMERERPHTRLGRK